MPRLNPKKFIGIFNNQYGCIIVSFIEALWYGLNFVLCGNALTTGLYSYVMRIDYYRKNSIDKVAMRNAALGMIGSILSVMCTSLLFTVAIRRGKLKNLIYGYVAKNVTTILVEFFFIAVAISSFNQGDLSVDAFVVALAFSLTTSLFWIYFGYIAVLYFLEIREREKIAQKLYAAYERLVGTDGNKTEKVDVKVKDAVIQRLKDKDSKNKKK